MPVVFPTVSLLSGCHSLLLLPGCSEVAPCAITGHCVSLWSELSGRESELAIGGSFVAPV